VILLHGLADSWYSFSRLLSGVSSRHRLYLPDLRGHGDSDRPADGYALRDLAADVVGFMDCMGIRRATLVGHSMGSFVAQEAAGAEPERVAGLVLIGSAATARNQVLLALEQELAPLPDLVPLDFVRAFQASTVHHRMPEDFMAHVVAESRKVPARVWRAALAGLIEREPITDPGEGAIPALLLWGDRDGIFTRSDQQALLAALRAATLKVYGESGHAPHWERPGEVVRDLEKFLGRTSW
jgi:pimeloyl-ACP methyl ester carboxylesterase